ncbi:alpha/beta hydrolase [Mucilaginibacter sp. RS28]|uniref:Alpha/beta hydrolase n=1 Tax=Mucilaginibacter straminoryzae TaxID=2932774 RepID=A0A9X1WYS0_9SPHI|nr:alpha/beta hydrolase [Mucilaginibacter straminoryzae]MCJ8208137.1 alpha/beta hydrolase [Mucilaginibacter straminoryzae]
MKSVIYIRTLLLGLLCLTVASVKAQTGVRYKDFVFNDVTVEKNQNYGINAFENTPKKYLYDLYTPTGDDMEKRPLIIWMHGGGFVFGSKDAKGIKMWCRTFARRGYVCAAINYSLNSKTSLFSFKEMQRGTFFAVSDARMAVAYFRKNAAVLHIDPEQIILAGNSAGGIIALHTAFVNNAELAKKVELEINDPGDRTAARTNVAAVINFWGGIYNLEWLKNAKIPIVNVAGSNDGVISPESKKDAVFGALAIHRKADELHIPNALKIFEGYSHELQKHFNPIFSGGTETEQRWMEAGQFTANFLAEHVVKGFKTVKVTKVVRDRKGRKVTQTSYVTVPANTVTEEEIEGHSAETAAKPVARKIRPASDSIPDWYKTLDATQASEEATMRKAKIRVSRPVPKPKAKTAVALADSVPDWYADFQASPAYKATTGKKANASSVKKNKKH